MIPLIAAAVSAIAPALAKQGLDLLSGVFRGAAGKGAQEVADLIEDKTGININDAADDKLTDQQWTKLKEFEFEYQGKLLEYRQQVDANDIKSEELAEKNTEDARDLQIAALSSDDKFAKRFIYFYASALTLLTFAFIFYACFMPQPTNDHAQRTIDTVLGFLLGVTLSAIIQFFFGSSAGSRSKEEKLNSLTSKLEKV